MCSSSDWLDIGPHKVHTSAVLHLYFIFIKHGFRNIVAMHIFYQRVICQWKFLFWTGLKRLLPRFLFLTLFGSLRLAFTVSTRHL